MKKVAVFEPYYGGSHKLFLDALVQQLDCSFELYTMPARKWKWRMRIAAPCFAEQISCGQIDLSCCHAILCSTFVDVAAFKGLLPKEYRNIPIYTYFHENQFVYPVQVEDKRDFHFALTNFTTALASDFLAFNSSYNYETFLTGCKNLLKKSHDMNILYEEQIHKKSKVMYPGLDFYDIDHADTVQKDTTPVILWNHRWEHDKNPQLFFDTLFALHQKEIEFKVIVVGESFQRMPEIFKQAEHVLKDKIVQFGYVPSRKEYIQYLKQADIVVSTANHEFFGISVIEAVRAGCYPLLPKRLSYPELFDKQFLYEDCKLVERLEALLKTQQVNNHQLKMNMDKFSWNNMKYTYSKWLNI